MEVTFSIQDGAGIETQKGTLATVANLLGSKANAYGRPEVRETERDVMFVFDTGQVWESVIVDGVKAADVRKAYKKTCIKCEGRGIIPVYSHVKSGICFKCWGSGDESNPAKIDVNNIVDPTTAAAIAAVEMVTGGDHDVPVNPHRSEDVTPDPEPEPEPEPTAVSIPEGTYTFQDVDEDGGHFTFRIRAGKRGYMKGKMIAQYLRGADNDNDFEGFAFVHEDGQVHVWNRFKGGRLAAMAVYIQMMLRGGDSEAAGLAYAMESGRCRRCNRTLTVPASIHRGYGPECATKVGL